MLQKFNYYDVRSEERQKAETEAIASSKTEFFRGRERPAPSRPRHYVEPGTVQDKTAALLARKAMGYCEQLRISEPSLRFEYMEQTRLLNAAAHLGYSAITSGKYTDGSGKPVYWVFYFSNFDCVFGRGETLFEEIPTRYGLTYFALAVKLDQTSQVEGLDTSFRGNGVIFSTKDPAAAFANVVKIKRMQNARPA